MSAVDTDIRFIDKLFGEQIMTALGDESVMDIIVNSDGKLIIDDKVNGKNTVGEADLGDIKHAMKVLCQYRGLFLNEETPSQTVQMPLGHPYFGARMKCLIAPCVSTASMVIRRHSKSVYPLQDFIDKGISTPEQGQFLRSCIANYRNISVCGITQSGKTALTASLINEISETNPKDRVLILETTPEIIVDIEDVQYMQTNPLSMQELVQNSTQMRPDRIIVGEVTDSSAHDMLKAWMLGSSGGICTFHAKDSKSAPLRLVELSCEKNIDPPISLINTVVDVIVHMKRDRNHKWGRKIADISELKGYNYQTKEFIVESITNK